MCVFQKKMEPYFSEENIDLFLGDSFEILESMAPERIDTIFADPPYFLSNGGFSCSGGKMVNVNKGEWDSIESFEAKHNFNKKWISYVRKFLNRTAQYGYVGLSIIFIPLEQLLKKVVSKLSII